MSFASKMQIETDMAFETFEDVFNRCQEDDEVGGVLVTTRMGLQAAEKVVKNGKMLVRDYVFKTEDGSQELKISCTDDVKFDGAVYGDKGADWVEAGTLIVGQEVWAVDPEKYQKALEVGGRRNIADQHYYAALVSLEFFQKSETYEEECFEVQNSELGEVIVSGMIVKS